MCMCVHEVCTNIPEIYIKGLLAHRLVRCWFICVCNGHEHLKTYQGYGGGYTF